MVTTPDRGQIWWGEIEDVGRRPFLWWGEVEGIGRRPFLIMTRSAAIPVLNSVLAAAVTRTIGDIPTELRLGADDGMPTECVAGFDNLRVAPKAYLVGQIWNCTRPDSPKHAPPCRPRSTARQAPRATTLHRPSTAPTYTENRTDPPSRA
jgi:mRNA interferase MazF